jgi:TPP-dependent pyruvate/acetoin dehydrogenase alpha subunit
MYTNTQSDLVGLGYKPDDEIMVFRGVHTHTDAKVGEQVNYKGNAMEAWSLSANVANGSFGAGGMTYAMKVPVRSLLGTCRTGNGCLNEGEVIVLGGATSTATVVK